MSNIECGRQAAKHFALGEGYRNLNHGSYGTYPTAIRDVLRHYQERIEARPDAFTRYEYREGLLDQSRAAIAKCVNAPGDCIISFSTIYGAFANTLTYLSETTPVGIKQINYTLPLEDDQLCDAFEDTIKALKSSGKTPRVAIFDTINTLPGVRMPFERLINICKTHDVLSAVDGAHGVGMIPPNLAALDPDFFASNCHKWLYTPRGSALLYMPKRNQHLLRATFPTSFAFGSTFAANFASIGTLDEKPYLTALEWRQRITREGKSGEEAIMGYMASLARRGGRAVASLLGTEVLENAGNTLGECSLTNVRLPLDFHFSTGGDTSVAEKIGQWMMRTMILDCETAVNVIVYANAWWVRLSSQIYLTMDDFEYAGQMLQQVCLRAERGDWKH
ncbi:hypothetical protein M409DRAFT_16652 [Zasmidium cellare ATCC 36951]|uniref:Aminotransferase class V domain-containing protein n=1 Tax=Zasmidium cellare ATCC 36951 TaxID=1080233 RepID=A0A6A6CZZ6_ZASCE|nr:uncharacterized protein M409DRAFT_16652 [Zasmidium cellare ATCC 36951]KAF2172691.1 hypothetical protein M409DRAFT_16652 [Zasmidium cellare ATCC 36951]